MKIALCQINPTVGAFEKNKELILKYYNKCIQENAYIVVFPELVVTGYPPQDLLWEEGFIEKNLAIINQIASHSTIPVIVGFIRKGDRKIFNSAAVCYDGKLQAIYDKILLPTYDVFDEDRYFSSGKEPAVISVPINGEEKILGIQICEDLWDRDYECKVSQIQKEKGAEILINISSSPYQKGRLIDRRDLIMEKVNETNIPFLYCNNVGAQDELIFDGGSLAFSGSGECIGQGKAFEEDLVLVDLDKEKPIDFRRSPWEENVYNALCLGVSDYFCKTGHSDAVLGLSGGIDSSLTACIAVDALGSNHVHGVALPSKFSSDHSLSDAQSLVKNLDVDFRIIPIQEAVDGLTKSLHPHFLGAEKNVAEENLQARVRGNLLMALSNKFRWLVLSTGNKTELALGYCTLYGDMNGGLAVISDLSKAEVYALSKWINKNQPGRIPENCITKLPSAELALDQIDPFDYEVVSPLVDAIVEDQKSPDELIREGADPELANALYQRVRINEYKRRQAPPGLRVSAKAFGVGRRIPVVNHYKGK